MLEESAPAPAPAPPNAPDWQTISKDVLCPLCDYNLRGLFANRCPECGYVFDWADVLNAELLKHPWLFEHARRRRFRSFFLTLVHGLRPRHFWKSVRATHEPRRKKLLLYWIFAVLLVGWFPFGLFVREAYSLHHRVDAYRAQELRWLKSPGYEKERQRLINGWGSLNAYLDSRYPPFWTTQYARLVWDEVIIGNRGSMGFWFGRGHDLSQALPTVITLIVWPWVTFITLMIFLVSMHKANVKPIHVLRCVIYSCDALWLALVLFLLLPDFYSLPEVLVHYGRAVGDAGMFQFLIGSFFAILVCYRLAAAYRLYLKFPHAIATALASQVMLLLALAVIVLNSHWR